jgi:hypothetical protein
LRLPDAVRFAVPAVGAIDQVNSRGRHLPDQSVTEAIPQGSAMYVAGWVVQRALEARPAAVFVTIDDRFAAEGRFGLGRPDVGAVHGAQNEKSGFEALVPTHALVPGLHVVGIALVHDATTYSVGPKRVVTIVPAGPRVTIATPLAEGLHIKLDVVHVERSAEFTEREEVIVPYGDTFIARGWAMDVVACRPCAGVYAIVGGQIFRARYGGERVDVAAAMDHPALLYTAFEIRIDSALVGIGDHLLRLGALCADGTTRSEVIARSVSIR